VNPASLVVHQCAPMFSGKSRQRQKTRRLAGTREKEVEVREGEGEAIEGSSRRDSLALFFSPWMIHASVREYQCGDSSSVSRRASECFRCNPHIYTYIHAIHPRRNSTRDSRHLGIERVRMRGAVSDRRIRGKGRGGQPRCLRILIEFANSINARRAMEIGE